MESDELRFAVPEIGQTKANGERCCEPDSTETNPKIDATASSLEGCLALGSTENHKYFTKHSIDYNAQNSQIVETLLAAEYLPCCRKGTRGVTSSSLVPTVLGTLRSEIFLYCLHLIVISLGVVKESVVVHGGQPTTEARLIYTSVETASTVILVLVRTVNAWAASSSAGAEIDRMGLVGGRSAAPVWRSMVRFFRFVSVAGGCLIVVCLASFVVCLIVEQLEWTVLSNVVCIVTINLLSALFTVRVTRTICWIRTDAYRLAVFEAVGMLRSLDRSDAGEATAEKEEDGRMALPRAFVDAFESTPMFQMPDYIRRVEQRDGAASRPTSNQCSIQALMKNTGSNGLEPNISNGLDISEECTGDNSVGSNSIAWNTYL